MKRISAANYPLTRDLVPKLKQRKIWLVGLGISLLLIVTGLWILLAMPLMILLLIALIHKAPNVVFTNFCQDAWLDDNELLLQFKAEQVHVPLDQIEKITWHGSNNPPRAKIWLRTANQHGKVFTYVPDLTDGRRQARANIESLNERLTQ